MSSQPPSIQYHCVSYYYSVERVYRIKETQDRWFATNLTSSMRHLHSRQIPNDVQISSNLLEVDIYLQIIGNLAVC